ncbi:hypothetical protein QYS48_09210 [Marivirga arenosa]|uniref:Heavy metal-binding domain-containing protein n=1 Tax=Marivirga arenosa TaxID=3059076 RepID=A0AA49GGF6_9BACT|nr:hypothetical protein [Marivirga sp. ABR2-2]WKK86991.1 hypothetical protein QYS48_09210 [Marivirga sp. ABR2-2]
MRKISIIIFVASLFFSSCSFYAYQYQTGSSSYSETTPESIKIYSGDIEQDYIVIGSVTADVMGDADAVVRYLKKNAAKLGADAIIKVDLSKMNSFSRRTGISGVAIKLK